MNLLNLILVNFIILIPTQIRFNYFLVENPHQNLQKNAIILKNSEVAGNCKIIKSSEQHLLCKITDLKSKSFNRVKFFIIKKPITSIVYKKINFKKISTHTFINPLPLEIEQNKHPYSLIKKKIAIFNSKQFKARLINCSDIKHYKLRSVINKYKDKIILATKGHKLFYFTLEGNTVKPEPISEQTLKSFTEDIRIFIIITKV